MKTHALTVKVVTALSLLLLLIGNIQAAKQSHILYKSEQPLPVGAVETKTEVMKMNLTLSLKQGDQEKNGSMVTSHNKKEIRTIKSKNEVLLEIETKNSTRTIEMAGKKSPVATESKPIEGKTVLLTKNIGEWTAKLVDEKKDSSLIASVKKIAKSMNTNTDQYILGTKPRQLGETWTVDASKIPSFLGDDTKDTTGSFQVIFKGLEAYEGEKCAVVHYDFTMKGTNEDGVIVSTKGKAIEYRSLKWCVAVQFSLKGSMTMGNKTSGMYIEGPMVMTVLRTIKKP